MLLILWEILWFSYFRRTEFLVIFSGSWFVWKFTSEGKGYSDMILVLEMLWNEVFFYLPWLVETLYFWQKNFFLSSSVAVPCLVFENELLAFLNPSFPRMQLFGLISTPCLIYILLQLDFAVLGFSLMFVAISSRNFISSWSVFTENLAFVIFSLFSVLKKSLVFLAFEEYTESFFVSWMTRLLNSLSLEI